MSVQIKKSRKNSQKKDVIPSSKRELQKIKNCGKKLAASFPTSNAMVMVLAEISFLHFADIALECRLSIFY